MQEIIKQIDELTEATNEKLCEIRNKLGKMAGEDKKYKMSAAETWDVAASISMTIPRVLERIYGMSEPMDIFMNHTPDGAKCLYDQYFKKKIEEETVKPGDRVDIVGKTSSFLYSNYIFVGEVNGYYYVTQRDGGLVTSYKVADTLLFKREE